MKKFFAILLICICVTGVAGYLCFTHANLVFAHIISNKRNTKVKVERVQFQKDRIIIHQVVVKNPKEATTKLALVIKKIEVIPAKSILGILQAKPSGVGFVDQDELRFAVLEKDIVLDVVHQLLKQVGILRDFIHNLESPVV